MFNKANLLHPVIPFSPSSFFHLHKPEVNSVLYTSVFDNFRPISKLPFMSKILEKVVLKQLHGILEVFQSGFKPLHSTESAL